MNIYDLNKMKFPNLKEAVKKITNRARAKYYRLIKAESVYTSPAITQMEETGGIFSAAGKTRQELLHEAKRAMRFMEDKTSTPSGAKKFYDSVKQGFEKAGVDMSSATPRDIDNFFKVYQKALDHYPGVANVNNKYEVFSAISERMKEGYRSIDQVIADVEAQLERDAIYEAKEADNEDNFGKVLDIPFLG